MSAPKSGEVVIGKKPLWELYVTSVKRDILRVESWRRKGAFTVREAAGKTGIAERVLHRRFRADGLRHETATDPVSNRTTVFYFPPGVKP